MTAQVTNTPIVTRLTTTLLISLNSENLRFIPPSNNITATQTETTGRSISPNILSGFINPYPGKLGVVEPGALADLLLVDGDPIANIKLVKDPEKNFVVIMKDGRIYKNTLK